MQTDYLVEVKNLVKYYPVTKGIFRRKVADVKAVDDISFNIKKGETIMKYGHDIGRAIEDIKKGGHVHVQNVKTKRW